jgi:hypothetical protein
LSSFRPLTGSGLQSAYVSPNSKHLYLPRKASERDYGFRVFFLLQNGSEWNSELFLSSAEIVRNGIPSFFYLPRNERNGIPSISAEQTDFRRNESKLPSVPCSTEFFFSSENGNPSSKLKRRISHKGAQ